ncbi:MAG: hypothetical protein MUE73_10825 [Planctomycetes bacterium]|jgi:hypothetical protein|nr:hypothetical protein [Planctomycetota bacterium]
MKTCLAAAAVLLSLALPALAGREDVLRRAVQGCDRVRVRSGGTCHRDEAGEKTLAEVTKLTDILALLRGIGIDEAASGGGCFCCGDPTFEFYRGEKLLAMVGWHHGEALRWEGGTWSGDGALTSKSAEFLCRWLAEHGVEGPLALLGEKRARERAAEERMRRAAKILPPPVCARLEAARSRAEAEAALGGIDKDPIASALALLRLYGCHEGNWDRYTLPESAARRLLVKLPPEVLGEAFGRLGSDAWALTGAARFIFENENERIVPTEALAKALPGLAAHAFAHPRREARHSAMAGVFRVGGPPAAAALRTVLAGAVKIRDLPESDRVEPDGAVESKGRMAEIRGATDDRVVAAVLLGKLGDPGAEGAILKLREEVTGPDRECLDRAVSEREQ